MMKAAFKSEKDGRRNPQSAPSRANKRVLIIDDNVDVADSMSTWLSISGHHSATAYNAKDGLAKALEFKPEYVVIDICLPDVNGYDLAEELRKLLGNDTILVAVTGYSTPNDVPRPFNYYLSKPITAGKLVTIGLLNENFT
jgi:CheY-like chemotaxis protein